MSDTTVRQTDTREVFSAEPELWPRSQPPVSPSGGDLGGHQGRLAPSVAPGGRRQLPLPVVVAVWTLASLSAVALWLLAFGFVLSGWSEHGEQRRLYAEAREELATQTGPIGGKIKPGAPIAVLDIARLHLHHLVVVEGTSAAVLRDGPGHRRDTPLPGQAGSSVIMGRSLLFGAPFAHIVDLRRGDVIVVETGQGRFHYIVDGTRRAGDPVRALKGKAGRLTLITARGHPGRTSQREAVFIDAHLRGTPQKAPSGRPSTISADEEPMAASHGAMVLIFLYLELLVVIAAAVSWAAARWGLCQSLIVGLPLIIATLWLVTDAAVLLLPNLS